MIILDHIVLNSVDVEKSADFYKKLLNVELENWQEFVDNKVKFPSLRISPTFIIDLFPPAMWNNQGNQQCENNLNHFCLAVHAEQWQCIFDYVKQREIKILRGPDVYFGAQGDGLSFYVKDPDGNTIEIRKYS
jgi:catechol 2,3-dioxygenase-like lactoylglutathione lyase family enzyme